MVQVTEASRSLTTDVTTFEQPLGHRKLRVDVSACSQPIVSDPDEPGRQGMQQEPPQELDCTESQPAGHLAGGIVSDSERDLVSTELQEPVVGDRDAMGVTAQVLEHLLRTPERCLGVDDPVGPVEPVFEYEPIGVTGLDRIVLDGLIDRSKELAPEQAGQNLHR